MMMKNLTSILKLTSLLAIVCVMGCAKYKQPDPLEPINRGIYTFNQFFDRLYFKPIAHAYETFIPKPFRYFVNNFVQNLHEIPTVANDLLQGRFQEACADSARFIINTTWGFGGLIDVAQSRGKLPRRRNDFGITLARWGYKNSSYFVIPFFGPSTIRDAFGRTITLYMSPYPYIRPEHIGNDLFVLYLIDTRVDLLKVEPAIGESVDEYIFVRDAFLQNRQYNIEGGETKSAAVDEKKVLEGPPE